MHWLTSILKERGKTQASFARALGVEAPRLTELKKGKWRLPSEKIGRAAAFLGISETELLALISPEHPSSSGTVKSSIDLMLRRPEELRAGTDISPIEADEGDQIAGVYRYDARLSAGPGSLVNGDEPLGKMPFEAQWLRSITTASTDFLAVVMVDGDSMEATLSDRDLVLIDRSQNRLGREGIYAIRVGDFCWIKRLSLNLRDRLIRIISDNPLYPSQELPEDEVDIIGRAVCIVARRL